jgi:DNA-binding YbaB/EbfC family protein
MNLGSIMKQAQQIQEQMAKLNSELEDRIIETSVGGGMVTVRANGRQDILSIKIAPEVVDPRDVAMLEDLVTSAVNEALRQAKEMMQQELGKLTGGLRIPGLNL